MNSFYVKSLLTPVEIDSALGLLCNLLEARNKLYQGCSWLAFQGNFNRPVYSLFIMKTEIRSMKERVNAWSSHNKHTAIAEDQVNRNSR